MEGNVNRILLNQILLLVVVVFLVDQVLGRSRFARMVENDAHITQDAPPAEEFLVIPGGTKCLKIFRDSNRTWTEAVAKCRSHGLQLAEPRDAVEVRKYIVDNYGDGHTWVGARGEGVNMRWIGSQGVLPEDSSLWYPSSPGNEVSRDYCLRLLTDSEIMTDKPVQPYCSLECSAMLTSTLCEEVPRLPFARPEPTAERQITPALEDIPCVGCFGPEQPGDAETQLLLEGLKGKVEELLQRKVDEFVVISYTTQQVAGTNYLAKIYIGTLEYIHISAFYPLFGTLTLEDVQIDKTQDEPLLTFKNDEDI